MKGSVYRRGATWTARWDIPGPSRRQRSKGGFKTKREAQEFLTAQLARLSEGHVDSRDSVAVFADRWLEAIKHEVEPSTWAGYETHWRVWLKPVIGNYKLNEVTADILQALYSQIVETRSPRTARYVHATAHRMWKDAIRWGIASRNPAQGAKPPKQRAKQKRTWTGEQTAAFLEHVAGSRWEPLWWFASDSAVRRGELVALTWPQVDGDTVTVWKGKTDSARRTITLLGETVDQLKAWRHQQNQERLSAGSSWLSDDHVWTWEDGRAIRGDWLSHYFAKLVRSAGLPYITLHELRHSWATQALQRGVPLAVVQHRLGHSSISVTADFYTRVPDDVDRAAAQAVGEGWRARNAHETDGNQGSVTSLPTDDDSETPGQVSL